MPTFRRNDEIVERRIGDERVLVPMANRSATLDSLYTLNSTAALVWDAAAEGASETQIVERIVAEYDVFPDQARTDVRKTIQGLLEIGALEAREENGK